MILVKSMTKKNGSWLCRPWSALQSYIWMRPSLSQWHLVAKFSLIIEDFSEICRDNQCGQGMVYLDLQLLWNSRFSSHLISLIFVFQLFHYSLHWHLTRDVLVMGTPNTDTDTSFCIHHHTPTSTHDHHAATLPRHNQTQLAKTA